MHPTISRSPAVPPTKRKPLIDLDAVAAFCGRHGAKSFSLFGSILTPEFDEESDVDVLVDFQDRQFSFHEECDMLEELEAMFGRKVDMVPVAAFPHMNRYRRESISTSAKEIYHAAA